MVGGDGEAWLFGGAGTMGSVNDLWHYDAAMETWDEIVLSTAPPVLFQHGMVSDGLGGLVVLGGFTTDGTADPTDVRVIDLATQTTSVPTQAAEQRTLFPFVDLGFDLRVGFGGLTYPTPYPPDGTTFAWNTTTQTLDDLAPASAPTARYQPGMAAVGENKLILFGGISNASGPYFGDTWEYVGPLP